MKKNKEPKKELLKEAIDNFNIDDFEEALKEGDKLSETEKEEMIKSSVSVDDLKEEDIIVIEKEEDKIKKSDIEKAVKNSNKESKEVSIEKINLKDIKKVELPDETKEENSMVKIKVKNQHHGRIVVSEYYNDGKKDRKRVYSILLREHISVDEIDKRLVKLVKEVVGEKNVEIIK